MGAISTSRTASAVTWACAGVSCRTAPHVGLLQAGTRNVGASRSGGTLPQQLRTTGRLKMSTRGSAPAGSGAYASQEWHRPSSAMPVSRYSATHQAGTSAWPGKEASCSAMPAAVMHSELPRYCGCAARPRRHCGGNILA